MNTSFQTQSGRMIPAHVALIALLAVAAPSALAMTGNVGNRNISPPQSQPHDQGYAVWAARFWQWALSFPSTANPAADTAPPETNQSGPVWFLPSVTGNRTVTRQM